VAEKLSLDFLVRFVSRQNERRQGSALPESRGVKFYARMSGRMFIRPYTISKTIQHFSTTDSHI
ncbi:hypothetical protein, partial [Dysgonomonas sp. 520]|uniref:hypothetical protein n=1 Tax=Dysgonomonas sp. 520 TaxID=2302931 RepID=UPI001C86A405